jgi:uncharacterized protein (TIGR03435 family)
MRAATGTAAILGLVLAVVSRSVGAQGPTLAPILTFDVASVRAIDNTARAPMLWQPPGHFTSGVPLISLISIGFQIPIYRIDKLPDWVRTRYFAINARTERTVEIEERPAYYRGLLADRFNLAVHVEQREMDIYTLTLARSDGRLGPNLRRSDVNCDAIIADSRTRSLAGERLPNAPQPGERPTCGAIGGGASFTGGAVPISVFVGMLAGALQRPIVDKTGLAGRFDIDFRAAPVNGPAPGPRAELPPIFTAVEDQLGLSLKAGRGPAEVLVIDRLEMPTGN